MNAGNDERGSRSPDAPDEMAPRGTRPAPAARLFATLGARVRSWEGFLTVLLLCIIVMNALTSPSFLTTENQVNLFALSIEKVIVALIMTFVILNAEIDLSVASMMGLSACALGWLVQQGVPMPAAIVLCLLIGIAGGAFNGFWITVVGLPSLVVTLAMLIGFRGLARVLVEDRSIKEFPAWFEALGQQSLIGPFPLSLILFFALLVLAVIVLRYSGFGRQVYVIGINLEVARYSGINVARVKMLPLHHVRFSLRPRRHPLRGPPRHGPGRHGARLRARHHHHRAARGGKHIRRRGLGVRGRPVDPHRAVPAERDVLEQHHRAPPDRGHWNPPDPVRYDSERAELSRPRGPPGAPPLNAPAVPAGGRRDGRAAPFAAEAA